MRASKGFTLVELMVVIGIIMILASMLLPVLQRAKESSGRAVCASNLHQIEVGLSLYAEENSGWYPPMDDVEGNLIVNGESVFPEYISDLNVFGCPSNLRFEKGRSFTRNGVPDPQCLSGTSYLYTGYLVTTDEEADAFVQALLSGFGRQFGAYPIETYYNDMDLSKIGLSGRGNVGSRTIYRIRTQVENIYTHEIWFVPRRGIPIIFDQIGPNVLYFSHRPFGANVAYMDGHMEFIRYKAPLDAGNFPVSPFMAAISQQYQPPDLSDLGCN